MNIQIKKYLVLYGILNTLLGYAGSDPVSWRLTPTTGFPSTQIGSQSIVTYTLTNHLPRAVMMNTRVEIQGEGVVVQDGCNQVMLQRGGSCQVSLGHTPTKTGATSFRLIYGYNNNRIPLPILVATAVGSQAEVGLTGTFINPTPFPAFFYNNQAPFVGVQFTNTGNTTLTNCIAGNSSGANQFTISPTSAATVLSDTPQAGTCGTPGNPVTLKAGEHCFAYGQLTSLQVSSNVSLNTMVTCAEARATATTPSFNINSSSGVCTSVSVQNLLPLPSTTYKYADNVVAFNITNTCATDAVALGPVSIVANAPSTATITTIANTYDHCSNQTLAHGQSCTVTASVIPTSIGSLAIQASVTPTGGALTSNTTMSTVASNQQSTHHILFVNQCNFDVWYGMANGTGANCPGPNCMTPDPNSGASPDAYHLPAQVPGQAPSTIDLSLSSYQNGAFWPRTGCQMQGGQLNCATGTCATITNSGSCNATGALVQPQAPFTKFEANLNPTAGTDGVYDVSAINGMTVPVEVKAFGPPAGNTATTVYTCSGAGALMQPAATNALGNCSWNYNPGSTISGTNVINDFYWVTIGADDGCSTSSLPLLCGMAWNQGPTASDFTGKTPINRRLGSFLGFNTLDAYAAYTVQGTNNSTWGSVNIFTQYGLDIQIPGQTVASNYGTIPNEVIFPGNSYLSYYALLSCPAISSTDAFNSCYQTSTNNDFAHCCGCVDWTNTLPEHACGYASGGAYTSGMNTDWTGSTSTTIPAPVGNYTPEQAVAWIKDACPTAYAYTYDDPSSSFTCTNDGATNLYTSYQVTFCPGGVSGLPAGAAEGRGTPP